MRPLQTYPTTTVPWDGTVEELMAGRTLGFYCWAHKQRTGEWPDQLQVPHAMRTPSGGNEAVPSGVQRVEVWDEWIVLRLKPVVYRAGQGVVRPPFHLSTVTGEL